MRNNKRIIDTNAVQDAQPRLVGISDNSSSMRTKADLQREINEMLAKVAELSNQMLALEKTNKQQLPAIEYAARLAQRYPFMYLRANNVDAANVEVGVHNASWFYSDSNGTYLYPGSPVQCHSLLVSKNGILKYTKYPQDSSFNETNQWSTTLLPSYTVKNAYEKFGDMLNSTTRGYGHPHVYNADESRRFVQYSTSSNSICFGSNRGVNEMLKKASSQADMSMILERLWAWLTEIYFGSVYHHNVVPLAAKQDVLSELLGFTSEMRNIASTIVASTEYTAFINLLRSSAAEGARIGEATWRDATKPVLNLACNAFADAFERHEDYGNAIKLLSHTIRFAACEWDRSGRVASLESLLCLHQLLSGVILLGKYGTSLPNGMYKAIVADMFIMAGAWREELVSYPRRLVGMPGLVRAYGPTPIREADETRTVVDGTAAWRTILRYYANIPALV